MPLTTQEEFSGRAMNGNVKGPRPLAAAASQPCRVVPVEGSSPTQGRHAKVGASPAFAAGAASRCAMAPGSLTWSLLDCALLPAASKELQRMERVIKYSDLPIRRRIGFFAAPIRVRRKASSSLSEIAPPAKVHPRSGDVQLQGGKIIGRAAPPPIAPLPPHASCAPPVPARSPGWTTLHPGILAGLRPPGSACDGRFHVDTRLRPALDQALSLEHPERFPQ
jgi:hypothetical protein